MKKLLIFLLAIFTFYEYRHYTHAPPDDMIDRLEKIRASFATAYNIDNSERRNVTIETSYLPRFLMKDSAKKEIRFLMRDAGIYRTSGTCSERGECFITASTGEIPWLSWLNHKRNYYSYGGTGFFDTEVVDDLEKAIEENDAVHYAFCERTAAENWFYCENNL